MMNIVHISELDQMNADELLTWGGVFFHLYQYVTLRRNLIEAGVVPENATRLRAIHDCLPEHMRWR